MAKFSESELLKKPYQQTTFTNDQLREFMKCADPITGPKYFINNYFFVQHATQGKILLKLFPYQEKLLDTYHFNLKSICMQPRQSGKTATAAGYLLWYAMFKTDQTILIAAHKLTGSTEIISRVKFGYESCPDFLRAGILDYNKQSVTFDNGSRILAQTTTPTTGRGLSISCLYADEYAFVPHRIASEFMSSIAPTLSTGGKFIITSTPSSLESEFARLWNGANDIIDEFGNTRQDGLGKNGFKAFSSKWDEHPERDQAWADQLRAELGDEKFRREVLCEFLVAEETLINANTLLKLRGIEPLEKIGQVRWYKKPTKGNLYVVGLDPSIGTGGDPAAIQIFDARTYEQIGEWTHNKTVIEKQVELLKDITSYLVGITGTPNSVYYSIENNSIGEAILVAIRDFGEENIPGIFLSERHKMGVVKQYRKGFNTGSTTKLTACSKLKSVIESGKMQLYSKKLVSELNSFVACGNSYKAKPGETDDLVMSTILIVRMLEQLKGFITDIEDDDDFNEGSFPMPFIMGIY